MKERLLKRLAERGLDPLKVMEILDKKGLLREKKPNVHKNYAHIPNLDH